MKLDHFLAATQLNTELNLVPHGEKTPTLLNEKISFRLATYTQIVIQKIRGGGGAGGGGGSDLCTIFTWGAIDNFWKM